MGQSYLASPVRLKMKGNPLTSIFMGFLTAEAEGRINGGKGEESREGQKVTYFPPPAVKVVAGKIW